MLKGKKGKEAKDKDQVTDGMLIGCNLSIIKDSRICSCFFTKYFLGIMTGLTPSCFLLNFARNTTGNLAKVNRNPRW